MEVPARRPAHRVGPEEVPVIGFLCGAVFGSLITLAALFGGIAWIYRKGVGGGL